jgi:hypothetical protein
MQNVLLDVHKLEPAFNETYLDIGVAWWDDQNSYNTMVVFTKKFKQVIQRNAETYIMPFKPASRLNTRYTQYSIQRMLQSR